MTGPASGVQSPVARFADLVGERARNLREAFDAYPEALGALAAIRDGDGRVVDFAVVYANPALERLTGIAAWQAVPPRVLDIVPAFGSGGQLQALASVVRTGRPWGDEIGFDDRVAGRRITGVFQLRAVRLGDGVLCLYRDVTPMRRAEEDLQRMAAIVEYTDDAIVGADPDGRITHWNAAAQRLLGYARAEILGRRVRKLVRPQDFPLQSERFQQVLAGRRIDRIETRWVRKDGGLLDVVLTASPIYDRTGAIAGVSAVVHDITARKRIESELRRSNAELEQFAALAAHDLREPFVAIVQGSRALDSVLRPELDARAREVTAHLRDAAAHGLRLIDALREYSRVGRAAPEEATIDVGELVGEILAALRPRLEETGARVVVGPLPTLSGDAGDIARVLQNLIANAVKFRSADPPRISVSAERATGWTISVEDNGVGVEPREAERIFELFARGDARAEAEGVGIGLAVCRKIVERHGGRIWVEPAPSGGSVFRFTLPG